MDPIDLPTLIILEKVDNESTPNQRDLTRDLNLFQGRANSFVKFVKISKRGNNGNSPGCDRL